MAGSEVPIVWRGRRARAFVPALLAEQDLGLTAESVRHTAAAAAEVNLSAAGMPTDYEPLARLLLRAEGVASSYIEGVTAPLIDVVLAESTSDRHTPAAWVAANLAAVTEAVAAADKAALSVELLCRWHRTVMTGSPTPERYVGVIRDEQGWIGGTNPLDAALVTPPPDRLPELLADLVDFVNRDDLDPVAQAGFAHAQFELIHPFGDGNGRVGRVLVSWLLARHLHLVTPPPVSIRMAADRSGYLAGLTMFRLGMHDPWVRWFAEAVLGSGLAQRALVQHVADLQEQWRTRLASPRRGRALRRDASAWTLLSLLPRQLALNANLVAEQTGQTTRAAANGLHALVEAGILVEHRVTSAQRRTRGRPALLYVSPELLALAASNPLS